jgi:glucose/arabinose dehydrogenase
MRIILVLALTFFSTSAALAGDIQTSAGTVSFTRVMGNLNEPWGLAFLPDGGFLVTERGGKLIHVTAFGQIKSVSGAPIVVAKGQGGLLDVMVPRDFASSREVFLSFSKKQGRGAGTALAVGKLSADGEHLTDLRVIFEMSPGSSGGQHFGGRIVEAKDGPIFLTIGERGDRAAAQDRSRHNGSIIRINRDGTVPTDNPFVGKPNIRPEIWSYGHRNPQGATLGVLGRLWANEHGAKGGDEINKIRRGGNFGWPVIAYGRHYSGAKIGEGTRKAGMDQPKYFWDPSIAPSGLMIYSGKLWPQWRANIFSGSLKFHYLSRVDPQNGWTEEKIQSDETRRVRDVREAPDGSIWFLSVGEGAIFRMAPG